MIPKFSRPFHVLNKIHENYKYYTNEACITSIMLNIGFVRGIDEARVRLSGKENA